MLISRDEPQITAFFESLFLGNQTQSDNERLPTENGTKINGLCHPQIDLQSIDEMPAEILRSIYIRVSFIFKM